MSDTRCVLHRLRSETRDLHDAIEAVPLHRRLAAGSLSLIEYAALLEALLQIHSTLDNLRDTSEGALARVASSFLDLRGALLDDLAAVPGREAFLDHSLTPALAATQEYTVQIRDAFRRSPMSLLGHLYVHHGSLLGGLHLRPLILQATGLPPESVRYYGGLGHAVPAAWRAFREALGNELIPDGEADLLVASARDAFAHTTSIYLAIDAGSTRELPLLTRAS